MFCCHTANLPSDFADGIYRFQTKKGKKGKKAERFFATLHDDPTKNLPSESKKALGRTAQNFYDLIVLPSIFHYFRRQIHFSTWSVYM